MKIEQLDKGIDIQSELANAKASILNLENINNKLLQTNKAVLGSTFRITIWASNSQPYLEYSGQKVDLPIDMIYPLIPVIIHNLNVLKMKLEEEFQKL